MANTRHYDAKISADAGLLLPTSAAAGKIAVSDASGNFEWKTLVINTYHAYVIEGAITVVKFLPFFIEPDASEQKVQLIKAVYKIKEGTSATLLIKKNAETAGEFKEMKAEKAKGETKPAAVTVVEGDELTPEVTAVSGSPIGLSLMLVLAHTL